MLKKNTWIILTYTLSLITLFLTFIIAKKFNIPFEKLTGAPALSSGQHPFIGVISNLGALLWCATVCICWFAGYILLHHNKKEAYFLLCSGGLSFILLIDDFFMFHDYIFYSFESFKIVQPITFSVYGLIILYFSFSFFKIIMKSEYIIFGIAFIFLGLSVFVDALFKNEGLQYFIEDSLKFIGIISWTLFFTTTSYKFLLNTKKIPLTS